MNPERITDGSIINWGRKYFGKDVRDEDVFLVETVLKDSEKGFFLPSSDPGRNKVASRSRDQG
jgi:hypothetical protein